LLVFSINWDVAAFSQQQVRMKQLSNDKEYAENYKTYSYAPLAFSCAQVVFRAKYMLEAEH